MKVLVTGATGFVGSQVVAALVRQGHRVRVLRRKTSSTVALAGFDVEHVYGDILERHAVQAAVEGCDRVFHVAALSSYWRARAELDRARVLAALGDERAASVSAAAAATFEALGARTWQKEALVAAGGASLVTSARPQSVG